MQFVVLACDGVWDVIDNDEAAQMVLASLTAGVSADEAAREVVSRAVAMGSSDNVTCMVLHL